MFIPLNVSYKLHKKEQYINTMFTDWDDFNLIILRCNLHDDFSLFVLRNEWMRFLFQKNFGNSKNHPLECLCILHHDLNTHID